MPLAALVTSRQARIEYANPQAEAMLGEALVGGDLGRLRWGAHFGRVLAGASRRAAGFLQWQDEARYRSRGGAELWVLETVVPIADAEGEIGCFLHFLQPLR